MYNLIFSKSMGICFPLDLRASLTNIHDFDRGPITQTFFDWISLNATSMSKSFCLCSSFKISRTKSSNFSTWSRLSGTDIRPCQWGDCIWTCFLGYYLELATQRLSILLFSEDSEEEDSDDEENEEDGRLQCFCFFIQDLYFLGEGKDCSVHEDKEELL